jgi:hypothetical protein
VTVAGDGGAPMTDEPDPFDQHLADEKARQERRAERQARFLARKETDDDAKAWEAEREAEKKRDADDTGHLRYFRKQTDKVAEQRNAGEKAVAAKHRVSYTQTILIAQFALFGKDLVVEAPSPQEMVVIKVGRDHSNWQHHWTRHAERKEQIAAADAADRVAWQQPIRRFGAAPVLAGDGARAKAIRVSGRAAGRGRDGRTRLPGRGNRSDRSKANGNRGAARRMDIRSASTGRRRADDAQGIDGWRSPGQVPIFDRDIQRRLWRCI